MNELKFLFQILADLYKKPKLPKIKISTVNLDKLLFLAKNNNLLYYTCLLLQLNYQEKLDTKQAAKINNIILKGKLEREKINNSISIINSAFEKYLLIKTYRGYPRIANDLDILVPHFFKAVKTLKSKGLPNNDFDKKLLEIIFQNSNSTKIHLHGKISWLNRSYFDQNIIWQQPQKIKYGQQNTFIPNQTADFLIHTAHMNFEPMHFTLSELLYLYNLADQVNWEIILQQSKKYHWHKTLIRTLSIFDDFHWYFYGQPSPFSKFKINNQKTITNKKYFELPKSFPRHHIVLAFLGKAVIWEPIKKITKVMRILISGDSHQSFYEAPEDRITSN